MRDQGLTPTNKQHKCILKSEARKKSLIIGIMLVGEKRQVCHMILFI